MSRNKTFDKSSRFRRKLSFRKEKKFRLCSMRFHLIQFKTIVFRVTHHPPSRKHFFLIFPPVQYTEEDKQDKIQGRKIKKGSTAEDKLIRKDGARLASSTGKTGSRINDGYSADSYGSKQYSGRDFHAEECHVCGVSAAINHTLPKRPVQYGRADKGGEKWEQTAWYRRPDIYHWQQQRQQNTAAVTNQSARSPPKSRLCDGK